MSGQSRVIEIGTATHLGSSDAPLQFGESTKPAGGWRGSRRLVLDREPAFELSFWCGTCPFLFKRLGGASRTLSADALTDRLNIGLEGIDADVLDVASQLVAEGSYLPILLEVRPRLIAPMRPGDYFAEDQVKTWGNEDFWGLPQYPRTPYYRTGTRRLDEKAYLYEFVVPMVPPTWNEPEDVAAHAAILETSSAPTCLAISVLDVREPAVEQYGATEPDLTHWCWASFLLDGHHKLQAAAESGRALRVMTLLALDESLATPDQLRSFTAYLA